MICLDIKLLIYLANIMLCIFGLLLIATGIIASKLPGPTITASEPSIVIGVFTCFLSIVGMLAVKLHQFPLMIITLIFLMCIFGSQMVLALKTLIGRNDLIVRSYLRNMYIVMSKNGSDQHVREIQDYYECCGFDGPDSDDVLVKGEAYISTGNEKPKLENVTILIPECCDPTVLVCTKLDAYTDSCVERMVEVDADWSKIIGIFLLLSSFILLLAVILGVENMRKRY